MGKSARKLRMRAEAERKAAAEGSNRTCDPSPDAENDRFRRITQGWVLFSGTCSDLP